MADVSVTILDTASPMIRRMAASTHDFTVPLGTAELYMFKSFRKQFTTSGKPKWLPLKASTIARRRKGPGIGPPKPLLDTGRLSRSYQGMSLGRDSKHLMQRKQLIMGTNVIYGAVHQFGYPPKKIPARPLSFQPEDIKALKLIIEHYIIRKAHGRP